MKLKLLPIFAVSYRDKQGEIITTVVGARSRDDVPLRLSDDAVEILNILEWND